MQLKSNYNKTLLPLFSQASLYKCSALGLSLGKPSPSSDIAPYMGNELTPLRPY